MVGWSGGEGLRRRAHQVEVLHLLVRGRRRGRRELVGGAAAAVGLKGELGPVRRDLLRVRAGELEGVGGDGREEGVAVGEQRAAVVLDPRELDGVAARERLGVPERDGVSG